jgi:hypothetical protein
MKQGPGTTAFQRGALEGGASPPDATTLRPTPRARPRRTGTQSGMRPGTGQPRSSLTATTSVAAQVLAGESALNGLEDRHVLAQSASAAHEPDVNLELVVPAPFASEGESSDVQLATCPHRGSWSSSTSAPHDKAATR